MTATTSLALITSSINTLSDGLYDILVVTLPVAIGFLVFYIGWNWARRTIGGR